MQTKKLTLEKLRRFINEAINEDIETTGEVEADEAEAKTDAEESEDALSESTQLLRWKKLAGLLEG
jgi:hypothetical protein|tara:strand:- start:376 stop:573 length:198 start_codon:yes stop_codon:yes gene_type:complete